MELAGLRKIREYADVLEMVAPFADKYVEWYTTARDRYNVNITTRVCKNIIALFDSPLDAECFKKHFLPAKYQYDYMVTYWDEEEQRSWTGVIYTLYAESY